LHLRQGQLASSVSAARLLPAFFAGVLSVLADGQAPRAELRLKSIDGQHVRLSDYRGKVVVLNFWATWCAPCAAELPMLVQAEKYYNSKGVVFIAASVDDRKTKKSVPNFVKKYNVSFPVWLNATTHDLLSLRMGVAVPSTAFLDREGRIAARVEGQMREEDLRQRLDWLLRDRTGPAPPQH
jgi:thiol-disulfide isomerase/thioredoxin